MSTLSVAGKPFKALISPYSLGCQVRAPLAIASTVDELGALEAGDRILLLHGELARGQLMPKNFPFYNPDEHKRIIALLEAKRPLAIIAATSRDPEMVGSGVYPFPLIEDGDFDIPSVYMTDEEGARLAGHAAGRVRLESRARRIPATGCNVVATKGGRGQAGSSCSPTSTPAWARRARRTTPAGRRAAPAGRVAGGLRRLARHRAGGHERRGLLLESGRAAVAGAQCRAGSVTSGSGSTWMMWATAAAGWPTRCTIAPRRLRASCQVVAPRQGLVEGEPWYQGDHGLFLINQIPALALTSEALAELMAGSRTPRATRRRSSIPPSWWRSQRRWLTCCCA